jgi:putative SOS response-associated peptidase YedK
LFEKKPFIDSLFDLHVCYKQSGIATTSTRRKDIRMCNRFTLHFSPEVFAKIFDLQELPEIEPRYNIAPSQNIATIRHIGDINRLDYLRWGLLPSWETDSSHTSVNARCETVQDKATFRHSLKYNRCIIPVSGFYEFVPSNNHKQPYYVRLTNSGLMGFAGLWEQGEAKDGSMVETCCFLTTPANELVRPLNTRMPLILQPEDYALWLNRNMHDPQELQRLYQPYPAEVMFAHPVPDLVHNLRFDSPACIVHM